MSTSPTNDEIESLLGPLRTGGIPASCTNALGKAVNQVALKRYELPSLHQTFKCKQN